MPIFTPGRRWQPPYRPFKKETAGNRLLITVEKMTTGPAFGCRMCGNCLLQETAFICPMECPKGMRNGPCGGSTDGKCEINPDTDCAWQLIFDKMDSLGRLEELLENQPIRDWSSGTHGGPGKIVREDVLIDKSN
jgi:hypothetical protein